MTKNTRQAYSLKYKPIVLLLIGSLWIGYSQAQESANSSGGNATGSEGTVVYSVGQVVFTTNSSIKNFHIFIIIIKYLLFNLTRRHLKIKKV